MKNEEKRDAEKFLKYYLLGVMMLCGILAIIYCAGPENYIKTLGSLCYATVAGVLYKFLFPSCYLSEFAKKFFAIGWPIFFIWIGLRTLRS